MKQAGENSNSLKMVFRNRPENEKIVRTTASGGVPSPHAGSGGSWHSLRQR